MLAKTMRIVIQTGFFLHINWLQTLLTLNNGVFPVIVKRSYVQLRDGSTAQFNMAHE